MILGIFTLMVAVLISGVSAFYSILGLTAIFVGGFLPIVIMGVALEIGKLTTVLWLHYNWSKAEWKIKTYLVFATCVIAFITSMGVFGALSKYHTEAGASMDNIAAQVSLFDEKIKTQRDNIDADRKALTQMDSAVDQLLSRTDTEQGATKSANLRQSQKKERARLHTSIEKAQKEINKLQEERAPIASQNRELESHIGPIKYIAALIYGDHADSNMLESAVRWVIIIIVVVFDPLAIVLLLAATTSIDWSTIERKKKHDKSVELTKAEYDQMKLDKDAAEEMSRFSEERVQSLIIDAETHAKEEVHNEYLDLIAYNQEQVKNSTEVLQEQQRKIEEFNNYVIENNETIVEYEKTCTLLTAELERVTGILDATTIEKEESNKKIAELTEIVDSLTAQCVTEHDHKNALQVKYDNTIEELAGSHKALTDLSVSNDHLTGVNDQLALAIADEMAISMSLSNTISELNNDIIESQYQLDATEQELSEVLSELNQLQDEESYQSALLEFLLTIDDMNPDLTPHNVEEVQVTTEPVQEIVEEVQVTTEPVQEIVEEEIVEETEPEVIIPEVPRQVELPQLKKKVPPRSALLPDTNFPLGGNASFGTQFPDNPIKGDLFLRVDFMPSKLFKWVGSRWIEVDKTTSDTYVHDTDYIRLIVAKVSSGEYDVDELTQVEQDQVAEYLRNTKF